MISFREIVLKSLWYPFLQLRLNGKTFSCANQHSNFAGDNFQFRSTNLYQNNSKRRIRRSVEKCDMHVTGKLFARSQFLDSSTQSIKIGIIIKEYLPFTATVQTNTSFGNLRSFLTILLLRPASCEYLISYFYVFVCLFSSVLLGKLRNFFKRPNYERTRHTDDNDNNIINNFSSNFHFEFNKGKEGNNFSKLEFPLDSTVAELKY